MNPQAAACTEAEGVVEDQIEEVRDGEQPKQDIIKLIIAKHAGAKCVEAAKVEACTVLCCGTWGAN